MHYIPTCLTTNAQPRPASSERIYIQGAGAEVLFISFPRSFFSPFAFKPMHLPSAPVSSFITFLLNYTSCYWVIDTC